MMIFQENLFPSFQRRKRSHGHRHCSPSSLNITSFSGLVNIFDGQKLSYTYTKPIAPSVFNYKQALQDFNSDCPLPTCSSSSSPYQPAGHVVSGDLNIVENTRLTDNIILGLNTVNHELLHDAIISKLLWNLWTLLLGVGLSGVI